MTTTLPAGGMSPMPVTVPAQRAADAGRYTAGTEAARSSFHEALDDAQHSLATSDDRDCDSKPLDSRDPATGDPASDPAGTQIQGGAAHRRTGAAASGRGDAPAADLGLAGVGVSPVPITITPTVPGPLGAASATSIADAAAEGVGGRGAHGTGRGAALPAAGRAPATPGGSAAGPNGLSAKPSALAADPAGAEVASGTAPGSTARSAAAPLAPVGEHLDSRAAAVPATAAQPTAGQATAGQATAGQATAGQATAGQATAGQATAGQATANRPAAVPTGVPNINFGDAAPGNHRRTVAPGAASASPAGVSAAVISPLDSAPVTVSSGQQGNGQGTSVTGGVPVAPSAAEGPTPVVPSPVAPDPAVMDLSTGNLSNSTSARPKASNPSDLKPSVSNPSAANPVAREPHSTNQAAEQNPTAGSLPNPFDATQLAATQLATTQLATQFETTQLASSGSRTANPAGPASRRTTATDAIGAASAGSLAAAFASPAVSHPGAADPVPVSTSAFEPPVEQPALAASLLRLRGGPDGSHQLTVMLHPADLGAVRIDATMRAGTLSLTVSCGDEGARQAVAAALPSLHHQLGNLGSVDVRSPTIQADAEHGANTSARDGRSDARPERDPQSERRATPDTDEEDFRRWL